MPSNRYNEHDLFVLEWWKGLALWYNEQDYAAAMSVWENSLRRIHPKHAMQSDMDSNHFIKEFEEALEGETIEASSLSHPRALRLWLFLGGCLLDAGRHADARWSLRACLREYICSSKRGSSSNNEFGGTELMEGSAVDSDDDDAVCIRAIQEYMASWQEEQSVSAAEHASFSRRVIQAVQTCKHLPRRVRQHWSDPHLRPAYMYPNVSSTQPFYSGNEERPSWCEHILEDPTNFDMIREECLNLIDADCFQSVGAGDHREGAGAMDGSVVSSGRWTEVVLFGSGERESSHLVPQTCELIARHIPEAVSLARSGGGEVIFSLLAPGTKIAPHCASTNLRLTAHLGIIVPVSSTTATDNGNLGKCRIRVKNTWHEWHQGKVLVFDDAYEHEVENTTDSIRVVLLIRYWHPSLPFMERQRALDQVVRQKQDDATRRYNPPLPVSILSVREHAMERSHCRRCGQTGYASIRLVNYSPCGGDFQCSCGQGIYVTWKIL
ncbi:hypothetical protein MPSEU_000584100 [Mayamaea pseudoterrestris]|nr:hypothetical protein MPSEU_000584100 [Mayamaea pseudoterrestris]